jgi:hypothetical protein
MDVRDFEVLSRGRLLMYLFELPIEATDPFFRTRRSETKGLGGDSLRCLRADDLVVDKVVRDSTAVGILEWVTPVRFDEPLS